MHNSCLSDPNFLAVNRLATQPFRNAELAEIPAGATSAAKAAAALKVKPHQLLYELTGGDGVIGEWVDSSREICAVHRGEVVLASVYSIAAAFRLPLLCDGSTVNKKVLAQCPNLPAVFAEPKRWQSLRPAAKRRSRPQEAGQDEVANTEEEEDSSNNVIDIRVFVSPRVIANGELGRVRVTPGAACLVIREDTARNADHDEDEDEKKNKKDADASNSKKRPAKLQRTMDLLAQLGTQAFSEHCSSEQFLTEYKEFIFNNEPLEGAQTVFVGSSAWTRIEKHLYATTLFSNNNNNVVAEEVAAASSVGSGGALLAERRGAPRRRLVALCSFGMPSESVLRSVMQRLKQLQAADPLQFAETGVVLFGEIPTLHYDPKRFPGSSKKAAAGSAAEMAAAAKRRKRRTKKDAGAAAASAPIRRARAKLAKLQTMITNLLSDSEVCPFVEMDVVVNAGSRYVPSPARLPSTALFKTYVRDLRGGVEVLDSASLVVSLLDSSAPSSPSVLVKSFADKLSIPFQNLGEFLGEDLLRQATEGQRGEGGADDAEESDDDGFAFFGSSSSDEDDDDDAASRDFADLDDAAGDDDGGFFFADDD